MQLGRPLKIRIDRNVCLFYHEIDKIIILPNNTIPYALKNLAMKSCRPVTVMETWNSIKDYTIDKTKYYVYRKFSK